MTLKIRVTKITTSEVKTFSMELLDGGSGDPDVRGGDGVYSRYLTDFSHGEGRYDFEITIDNDLGNAFTFQQVIPKGLNNSLQ